MVRVDDLELAYIAGFFDGEGCVFINNYTASNNGKRYASLRVMISNTNLPVLEYIQARFGGRIVGHNSNGNRKQGYELRLASWEAKNMLELIYPYLNVKSEQATIGISFQDTMNGYAGNQYRTQLPQEIVEYRNSLDIELSKLNRRGIY